jgi:DnaK suppressor protein
VDETRARERLEQERQQLLRMREETAQLSESQNDSTGELSSLDQHPADVATETFEREKDLSIAEHIESGLTDIDDALRRLDEGTYGRCVDCGREIPDERLEAMPTASRCVEDQEQAERTA